MASPKLPYLIIATLLFLITFSSFVHAQQNTDSNPPKQNHYLDPSVCPVKVNTILSNKGFLNILDKYYSSIATGLGPGVSLTDYGAIDPVAGTFTLNVFRIIKWHNNKPIDDIGDPNHPVNYCPVNQNASIAGMKNWYVNLTAAGSIIGNNTAVLFNNSKFNSGLTVTGKVHIPVGLHHILLEGKNTDSLYQWKKNLENQRWAEKRAVWTALQPRHVQSFIDAIRSKQIKDSLDRKQADSDAVLCSYKVDSLRVRIKNINVTENAYKSDIEAYVKYSDSLQKLFTLSDSLGTENVILKEKIDSACQLEKVVLYDALPKPHSTRPPVDWVANYGDGLYTDIDSKYNSLIDSAELKVATQPYWLKWIAVVGSYSRNDYYTYYDSLLFSQRLSKSTLNLFNYGVEFNLLHSGSKHLSYLNLGIQRIRNNNIADLSTSKLNKSIKSSLNDTSLSLSKDYNVYTDSIEEYEAWKPYVNYYFYFDRTNKQAVHALFEAEFRTTGVSPLNFGAGYIFSIKNSKDNSILNIEAYIKFIDVFYSLSNEKAGFFNRNTVGILLCIPFTLPTSN